MQSETFVALKEKDRGYWIHDEHNASPDIKQAKLFLSTTHALDWLDKIKNVDGWERSQVAIFELTTTYTLISK